MIFGEKRCIICGKIFHKRNKDSRLQWASRRFCSRQCRYKSQIGKVFSSEHRKKQYISHIKYYDRIGRIGSINKLIRQMIKYSEWRLMIFGRDNYTCQKCGIRGCYLEPHHMESLAFIVNKYNIKTMEEASACEELWDLNNGITLCKECHSKTNNYKGRYKSC